jgi:hypothetical protein
VSKRRETHFRCRIPSSLKAYGQVASPEQPTGKRIRWWANRQWQGYSTLVNCGSVISLSL